MTRPVCQISVDSQIRRLVLMPRVLCFVSDVPDAVALCPVQQPVPKAVPGPGATADEAGLHPEDQALDLEKSVSLSLSHSLSLSPLSLSLSLSLSVILDILLHMYQIKTNWYIPSLPLYFYPFFVKYTFSLI